MAIRMRKKSLKRKCEWRFPDSKAERAALYTEESIVHPAKMDVYLARALVRTYVKPGDVVCDLMSGIGTTGVEVLLDGRAGGYVGAEYEPSPFVPNSPEFSRMQAENLERHDQGQVPWAVLHTDSKQLWKVLEGTADAILFSPPFGTMSHSMGTKVSEDFRRKYPHDCHYSNDPRNAGNSRSYGCVDTMLLSPPFPNANTGGSLDNLKAIKISKRNAQILSHDPRNIDNLKRYGNIDTILLSPPFEGVTAFQDPNIAKWRRNGKKSKTDDRYMKANRYGKDPNNVGQTKGKTYWGMMYQIYASAAMIIKPGGVMVIHTKSYVRKGKIVPLNLDTIRVCEALGFELMPCPECGEGAGHTHRRLINNPSAWVNIRVKRWVDAGGDPAECPYNIRHEDIMVFKRR